MPDPFNMFDPRVLEILKTKGLDFCKTISSGLKNVCKDAIDEGMANGESIRQIRNRLMDSVEGYSRVNANRVARTETSMAANQASLEAYKQSGVVSGKIWLAAGNSCEECLALDGVEVGLDEDFPGGIDAPPLHANCVCTTLASLKE